MAGQLEVGLRLTRTAELRLDWLRDDGQRRRFLGWLEGRLQRRGAPVRLIATCRRQQAGGRFSGSIAAQRRVLEAAVRAGCMWYDLEIESIEASGRFEPIASAEGRAIVSLHRFDLPTRNPAALLRRFRLAPGAIWKLAVECRNLRDAQHVIRAVRQGAPRRRMILVPMGRAALPMRILALRDVSLLTYAAVSQHTAPGQPTLEAVKQEFRADRMDRRTRVYGIIGSHVGHSISPAMHNAAFAAAGMNSIYLPFLVEDLKDFLTAVGPLRIRGFSVTIPHKQAIFRKLQVCNPLAKRLGAVNTVVVRGDRLYGYNTDYAGVLAALGGHLKLAGCRTLLLGAGGAARAAAFALADSGAKVFVLARRAERARKLAREVGGHALARIQVRRQAFDLIVNATPVGMAPDRGSPLGAAEINAPVVFDMVYRPLETPLLRLAVDKGCKAISGLDMLVAQGVEQWKLWTGKPVAPARRMRQAALAALSRDEEKN